MIVEIIMVIRIVNVEYDFCMAIALYVIIHLGVNCAKKVNVVCLVFVRVFFQLQYREYFCVAAIG
jgi:hypothetical protein